MSNKRDELFRSDSSEEEHEPQPPAADNDDDLEQPRDMPAKDQPLIYDRPDYKDIEKNLDESLELKQRATDAFSKKDWDAVAAAHPGSLAVSRERLEVSPRPDRHAREALLEHLHLFLEEGTPL